MHIEAQRAYGLKLTWEEGPPALWEALWRRQISRNEGQPQLANEGQPQLANDGQQQLANEGQSQVAVTAVGLLSADKMVTSD